MLNGISVFSTATLQITESRVGGDGVFFSVRNIALSSPGYRGPMTSMSANPVRQVGPTRCHPSVCFSSASSAAGYCSALSGLCLCGTH